MLSPSLAVVNIQWNKALSNLVMGSLMIDPVLNRRLDYRHPENHPYRLNFPVTLQSYNFSGNDSHVAK